MLKELITTWKYVIDKAEKATGTNSVSWLLNLAKWFNYQSQNISDYDNEQDPVQLKNMEVERNLNITLPKIATPPEAKVEYYNSLDSDDKQLFDTYKDEWYWFNAIQALMSRQWDFADPSAQWLDKYKKGVKWNVKDFMNEMVWYIGRFWEWLSNLTSKIQSATTWEEVDSEAYTRYIQDKYWVSYPAKLDKATRDMEYEAVKNNPSLLKQYSTTWQDDILDIWEWWLDAAVSSTPLWLAIKWWLIWVSKTQEWQDFLWWVSKIIWFWGRLLNYIPWLSNFREWLSEDRREEFDEFMWNLLVMKLATLKNTENLSNWQWRTFIKENFTPSEVIRTFNERFSETPKTYIKSWLSKGSNTLEWIGNRISSKVWWVKESIVNKTWPLKDIISWKEQTPEQIAGKIVQWEAKDQAIGRKVLTEDMDTTGIKDFKWLRDRASETKWKVMDELNKELDKEEWLLRREDLMEENPQYTVLWPKTTTEDFFTQWLDALIKRFENRPSERVKYEAYKEKMNWEWLTRREAYDVTRAFWKEFSDSMFKKDDTLKNSMAAKDAEAVRQWMKTVIRGKLKWDYAKQLDEKYWRLSRVEELADEMYEKVIKADQKLADKNIVWRIWDLYKKTIKKIKWENPDSMSVEEIEASLEKNLEKLNKAYKDQFIKERLDFSKKWEGFMKFRSKNADYMIASAENPMWNQASVAENARTHNEFKKFLDDNDIAYKEQKWKYGQEEKSFIIAIDKPQQRNIIDSFLEKVSPQEENIIVKWGNAYRYDPRTNEAYKVDLNKWKVDLPAETNDFYSEIDWRKYQLPLYNPWVEIQITPEEFLSVYNS